MRRDQPLHLTQTTVLIDFDGTISREDVNLHLLERFAGEGWEDLDRRYETAEIGSRQYVTELWKLLPADLTRLQRAADEIPLDPELGELARFLDQRGAEVIVVSDGLGFYVEPRCAPYGLKVVTNTVESGHALFPYADPTCPCGLCGTCKPAQVRAIRAKGRSCVLVGDGTSDRFAAAEADLVFAKDRLVDWCQSAGLPFVPFDNLGDVERALRRLDGRAIPLDDLQS